MEVWSGPGVCLCCGYDGVVKSSEGKVQEGEGSGKVIVSVGFGLGFG